MGNETIVVNYGYITGDYVERENEYYWTLERVEQNGETVSYNCIKSTNDMEGMNVFNVGNDVEFITWRDEFVEPETTN